MNQQGILKRNPKFLKTSDIALVTIKPLKPICVETFADCPTLGRFIVRDKFKKVAVGVITSTFKYDEEFSLHYMDVCKLSMPINRF